jgi:hypothetical protein
VQQHARGVDDRREQRVAERLGAGERGGRVAVGDRGTGEVDVDRVREPHRRDRPGERIDRRWPVGCAHRPEPTLDRRAVAHRSRPARRRPAAAVLRASRRRRPRPVRTRGDAVLRPGVGGALVPTGISIAIPVGYCGLVMPRSGLALKHGLSVVNAPGLIDAAYRGEIKVVLLNTDPEHDYELHRGDRSPSWSSSGRSGRVERGARARRRRPRRWLRPHRPLSGRNRPDRRSGLGDRHRLDDDLFERRHAAVGVRRPRRARAPWCRDRR